MIDDELRTAVTDAMLELCCRDGTLKERLLESTHKLDLVIHLLLQHERWPSSLLQRAEEIDIDLHSQVNLQSTNVEYHEAAAARCLAERILHLYSDVQRVYHDSNDHRVSI